MIENFNFTDYPKDYDDEKCDDEKNKFLCDSHFNKKKYSTLDDSM